MPGSLLSHLQFPSGASTTCMWTWLDPSLLPGLYRPAHCGKSDNQLAGGRSFVLHDICDVIHAFLGVTGFGSPVAPKRGLVSTGQIPGCTGSSQYQIQSSGCSCERFHRPLKTAMRADSIQPLRRTWMLHLPGWFWGSHTMFWGNFCQRGLQLFLFLLCTSV